jgi:hypothetical protein
LVSSVTETRPCCLAVFCFCFRVVLLDKHLADLMFADRRRCDGFATGKRPASYRA